MRYHTDIDPVLAIEWDHDIEKLEKCESDVSPYEEMLKNRR